MAKQLHILVHEDTVEMPEKENTIKRVVRSIGTMAGFVGFDKVHGKYLYITRITKRILPPYHLSSFLLQFCLGMSIDDSSGNWKQIDLQFETKLKSDTILQGLARSQNSSKMFTYIFDGETIAMDGEHGSQGKYNKESGEISWDDGSRWVRQGTPTIIIHN